MKKTIIHFTKILIIAIFSGCYRLDDFLFEPTVVDKYQFEKYDGETHFNLDDSYSISDTMINELTLYSKDSSETETIKIKAVYLGSISRIPTDTVIVYCHGNYGNMDFYWNRAKLLAFTEKKHRYGVMMVDYRGYGLSEGTPSEMGLYADVDAAISWLKDKGLKKNQLVLYGYSLGSAPATMLTGKYRSLKPLKLILESPISSTEVMVQDAGKLAIPSSFFINLKINNVDAIREVRQPLLYFHGIDDSFLSIESHGDLVYSKHTGKWKDGYRVEGAGHNDVPVVLGFNEYTKIIAAFIVK